MHAEPQIGQQAIRLSAGSTSRALVAVVATLAFVFAVFWPTFTSMTEIWTRSETFTHGWLVIPAFLWFAWQRREELASTPMRPFWPGLIAIVGAGFGWLAAHAAGVGVVQQLAMVALVPACLLTALGWRFAWALAFPLAFLFFAVPVGEALVPPLMDLTADFTVAALQITGIPVFREGNFFVIPSGNWSIVEGCSGLRYLIASVTVGCVYAYLTYYSFSRRIAFIAASIATPIVANWMRAYIIVMLGHLSGNKIATGVDHLIYGWVFFGMVMMLLFWIGSFWREDERPVVSAASSTGGLPTASVLPATMPYLAAGAMAAVLATLVWPVWAAILDHRADADERVIILAPPADAGGWVRQKGELTSWRPHFLGGRASVFEVYARGDERVVLYLAAYRNQKQGLQLISSQNYMIQQKHAVWSNVGEGLRTETVGASAVPIRQTKLRSVGQRLLIWDWFVVSGRDLANPYVGKLLQARDKLLGRGDDGAAIIIAAPYVEQTAPAEAALRDFASAMRGSIDASLADAMK